MLTKYRTFKGGFSFRNYGGQPSPSLVELKIPQSILVPLRQGFGVEVEPLVKKGDKVYAGQIIGRDDNSISSPVHSSVNGYVEDIAQINYFKREVTVVSIRTTDFSRKVQTLPGHTAEWWRLGNKQIEELIYLSGVSALDREGIPTHFNSSVIQPEDVKHLVAHGVGSEPYNASLDLLLEGKNLLNFFEGIKILKRILQNAKVHIAINAKAKKFIEQMTKLFSGLEWIDICPVEPKYPQGYDELLVPTILNQRFPYGYSAANIGVVVLNIRALLSVHNAVVNGMPLVERIIALSGSSFKENNHASVRIGTPLADVVSERLKDGCSARVVKNSLLTGEKLTNFSLPVDRTFSQIVAIPDNKNREFLAFMREGRHSDSYTNTFLGGLVPWLKKYPSTNQHGEERPCISCGYCEDVCPVGIIPHLLSKYIKKEIIDETIMNYNIFNCIECGLCSFVCPSKIALSQHMKEGQDKLILQGCDRGQCILPYFDLKGLEEYRGVTRL